MKTARGPVRPPHEGGPVQCHDAGIVARNPVDRARAETEHQARHPGGSVDVPVPDIQVGGIAHTSDIWKEQRSVPVAGNPLYQQRHLFVPSRQTPLVAVGERIRIHGARVHLPYRVLKLTVTGLRSALARAEYAFVLSAKALPNWSSSRLEERTMIGELPKYSSIAINRSRSVEGNTPCSSLPRNSSASEK